MNDHDKLRALAGGIDALPRYRSAASPDGKMAMCRDDTGIWVRLADVESAVATLPPSTEQPEAQGVAVAFRYLARPKVMGWSRWLDISDFHHFKDGVRVEGLPPAMDAEIEFAYTAAPKVAGGACHWRQQDEIGDWVSTGCGKEFVLNDASQYADGDSPFPFCAYCAKPMKFYRWRDESPCTCDSGDGPECEGCADNKRRAALTAAHQQESTK